MAVRVDGWRGGYRRARHVARATVCSLVGMPTRKLRRGRGGEEQFFYHPLILVHIIRIAISLVGVVEIGLVDAILSGPLRARGDAGASAPIAHDRFTRITGTPLGPMHV